MRQTLQRHRKDARARQGNIRERYMEARKRCAAGVAAEEMLTTLASEGSELKKEGWLTKLSGGAGTAGAGLGGWKRKWFVLENGRFCYRKDSKTTEVLWLATPSSTNYAY